MVAVDARILDLEVLVGLVPLLAPVVGLPLVLVLLAHALGCLHLLQRLRWLSVVRETFGCQRCHSSYHKCLFSSLLQALLVVVSSSLLCRAPELSPCTSRATLDAPRPV